MRSTARLVSPVVVFLLAVVGCGKKQSTPEKQAPPVTTSDVEVEDVAFQVSGPHVHENLSVFLIQSSKQDERNFLSLEEGLTKGLVKITEQEQETVGSLLLDNQSDRPLYLQEGERLQGGKQDRTIAMSLVVPPNSGKTNVSTFCIEQSRWQEGSSGRKFNYIANTALAPKGVRGPAKYENSQGEVWNAIAVQKATGRKMAMASGLTSSANELLDSPTVKKISDEYSSSFADLLAQHRDAVGVAIAVNGQIEEVNVYPNHALFSKYFTQLVRSYALQAKMLKDQPQASSMPTSDDVAQLLKGGEVKSRQSRKLDARNEAQIREFAGNRFSCKTHYDGTVVHWQVLRKNRVGDKVGNDILGNDW